MNDTYNSTFFSLINIFYGGNSVIKLLIVRKGKEEKPPSPTYKKTITRRF